MCKFQIFIGFIIENVLLFLNNAIMRATIIQILFLIGIIFSVQAQTIVVDGEQKDFVSPGHQTCYVPILPSDAKMNMITWHVTNGSFSQTSDVSSIQQTNTGGVCVYWKNPEVSGGTPPKGSIYAEIRYSQAGSSKAEKTTTLYQNIISYKNVIPPSLEIDKTFLPFGEQTMKISFSKDFYLPYKTTSGQKIPVTKLEWTLPPGWKSGNNSNTFITDNSPIQVKTNILGEGVVKVRGVNPDWPDDKTNYSEIAFKRQFNFSENPSKIEYGVSQTFKYTVSSVAGVVYEWKIPSGWTVVSGGNTNSVTLAKDPCATSADVKVRLKAGSSTSDWYTAPNTTILPPELNIPSIEQFRDISISINIPNDKIQSFSISGNGVDIVSGQQTNTLICRFNKEGSQEVNVSLALKGCGNLYTFKKVINVSKIQLSLLGPDIVCPYDAALTTYSVPDLPANSIVSWSYSGGISLSGSNIGSNCSVRGTTPGKAQIQANVNISGATIKLLKNIEVASTSGSPYLSYTSDANSIYLTIHTPNMYGIREFIWNASSISGGSSLSSRTGPNGNYWTIPKGHYNVECRVVTQCVHVVATTTIGGYRSTVYPNPVDHTLYVEIMEEQDVNNASVQSQLSVQDLCELRLFNSQGILVRNLRITDRKVTVDVSGLPEGYYFLHILNKGMREPKVYKVIIKH